MIFFFFFCIALFSKCVQAASERAKTCMKCRNRSKRNHLGQLGGCLASSFASRIRQRTDRRGVLPESLMRAINTGKSMLAGILSQTSGSWLFPVIYCPHHRRPIRACKEEAPPHCAIALGHRRSCPTEAAGGPEGWDPHVRHNEARDRRLQLGRSLTAHHPPLTGNEPKRPDRSRERDKLSTTEVERIQI